MCVSSVFNHVIHLKQGDFIFISNHALVMNNLSWNFDKKYRQISNASRILVVNKIVEHSDEVGSSSVGAAPTTSSFST